jgi:arylsulfatase A-like enzyme
MKPPTIPALLFAATLSPVLPCPGKPASPNVLLILVDDMGDKSLGCFGCSVPTPNLDRLAGHGMVFTNAHACPMCAPTRDEMLTGISRARTKGRPGRDIPFFTNHLQKLGYTTGMAGKWFAGSVFDPPLRGFDESCIMVNGYRHWAPDVMVFGSRGMMKELNQPQVEQRLNEWEIPLGGDAPNRATRLRGRYAEDVSVDFLCDFIDRHSGTGTPFFAYYSSKLVHVPHSPNPGHPKPEQEIYEQAFARTTDRDLRDLSKDVGELARKRGVRIDSRDYREQGIAYLDKLAGRLVAKLTQSGVLENTLILFASDNGNSALDPIRQGVDRLPGRKGDSRDGGTRIPLVAHWPARIKGGQSCGQLVHVQDLGPTLLELAAGDRGLVLMDKTDGVSFAPVLLGKPSEARHHFIGCGAHPSVWLNRVRAELGQGDMDAYRLVWTRGDRFKLYNDGRLYDLQSDLAEEHRIPRGHGSETAESFRRKMEALPEMKRPRGD